MTVFQCGFIANGSGVPSCSKDISSAVPVPLSAASSLSKVYDGGWGFGLAASEDGKLQVWGVNQATIVGKNGEIRLTSDHA